jgi:hypothetical protein
MTKLLLVFVPSSETKAEAVLLQLEALASTSSCVVDGPHELEGPVPGSRARRFAWAAEVLERAARSARISEGLARAKAEGRRIGRPIAYGRTMSVEVASARDSGASWGQIGHKYGIPRTSARRLYLNALVARSAQRARRREARRP